MWCQRKLPRWTLACIAITCCMPVVIWLTFSSKERSEWTPYSTPEAETGTAGVALGGVEELAATVTEADAVSPEAIATTVVVPRFFRWTAPRAETVAIVVSLTDQVTEGLETVLP